MTERRGKRLPAHLVNQIRRLRREGLSIRAIEQLTGCARSTVEIYTAGLPVPGSPQRAAPAPKRDEIDAEIDELFVAHDEPPDAGNLGPT